MSATSILSEEQRSVLRSAYSTLRSATIYLSIITPAVSESDAPIVESLTEICEMHLKRLPQYFPELADLEPKKQQGGGQ